MAGRLLVVVLMLSVYVADGRSFSNDDENTIRHSAHSGKPGSEEWNRNLEHKDINSAKNSIQELQQERANEKHIVDETSPHSPNKQDGYAPTAALDEKTLKQKDLPPKPPANYDISFRYESKDQFADPAWDTVSAAKTGYSMAGLLGIVMGVGVALLMW